MDGQFTRLMEIMVERHASDMYVTAGRPIMLRVDDALIAVDEYPVQNPESISTMLTMILGAIIMWIAAGVFGPIYGILGKLGA